MILNALMLTIMHTNTTTLPIKCISFYRDVYGHFLVIMAAGIHHMPICICCIKIVQCRQAKGETILCKCIYYFIKK